MSISVTTRFRIPLRAADIEYLVGNSSYTYDEVKALITEMLNDVLEATLLNIEAVSYTHLTLPTTPYV